MDINKLLAYPADTFIIDSQTAATATATLSAPGADKRLIVLSASISADRAPTAAITITLKNDATTIKQWEVPAAAFAPMEMAFPHGLKIDPNKAAVLSCGSGGTGVKITLGLGAIIVSG